jgi:hypothetical protein
MERAHALASLNVGILAAYSRRTIESLRAALPLRLPLRHLEPVLALNVGKDVRKDALAIRCDEIALLRAQRMERLLETAYRILSPWRIEGGLRLAVEVAHGSIARDGPRGSRGGKVTQSPDAGKVFN